MTDIRPSPEMLDAAAANRREAQERAEAQPIEDRDLDQAIAAHRILFRVETGILKLHQRDGESGLGPPFHPIFQAFLDEQYGAFPWNRALYYLRYAVCRKTHTGHTERPEWRGSLCHSLVSLVIRQEIGLDYARLQLGLPDEGKSRRTLDSALLVIEKQLTSMMLDERAKQAPPARKPSEWMLPPHVHLHPPDSSLEDCPQCLRRRVA